MLGFTVILGFTCKEKILLVHAGLRGPDVEVNAAGV